MSCFITDFIPKSRDDFFRPLKLYNDELIAYKNGLKVDHNDIRYTLNVVYQEEESCLFCKSKEEGDFYVFYGSFGSLFDELLEDLDSAYCFEGGLNNESFNIEIKPFRAELIFKLKIKYYDALDFFKKKTEEAIRHHKDWMNDNGWEYDWFFGKSGYEGIK